MQGLTEVLFRRVYEKCFPQAIPLAVSPFISLTHNLLQSPEELSKNGKLADILPSNNSDSIPVIPQILGKEPDEFIAVANCLYEMGYQEVNWNIGCPMRQVTAKHRGSGILPYPEEVRHILDAIIPNMKPALSVKMRIGLRDKSEIFNIIPVLNDYPLASVTIHPRLGRQQYPRNLWSRTTTIATSCHLQRRHPYPCRCSQHPFQISGNQQYHDWSRNPLQSFSSTGNQK